MRTLLGIRPLRPAAARVSLQAALLATLFGAAPRPAAAHEYWLAPSSDVATAHRPFELAGVAGTGFRGERKPFTPPHCARLVVAAARVMDLAPVARDGEYAWARFAPADDGGAMLAFESDFTPIALPAAAFDEYLALEGLDGPLAVRRRRHDAGVTAGRERFRRCAKAWLDGGDAARATTPIGLPLEIVPLAPPGRRPRLAVRVLWQGRPLAGTLVRAWRAPLGSDPESRDSCAVAWQAWTDARGEAVLTPAGTGEWLLSTVHMVPAADRGLADWDSTWASLTFARRAAATAEAPARTGATR